MVMNALACLDGAPIAVAKQVAGADDFLDFGF